MSDEDLLDVLRKAATAVMRALRDQTDWGPSGLREGQYSFDIVADNAAVPVLLEEGLGVLSEESGLHEQDRALLAVVDPLDGSTNASRRIPWYATSICVVDEEGPLAALVVNHASAVTYEATRGGGARRNGVTIGPSRVERLRDAVIGVSGYPPHHLGWHQYRALGAIALDLCAVADGTLDGYLDCGLDAHGAWDYLGGVLICSEAGVATGECAGRSLLTRGYEDRRSPAAGATEVLLDELMTSLTDAMRSR